MNHHNLKIIILLSLLSAISSSGYDYGAYIRDLETYARVGKYLKNQLHHGVGVDGSVTWKETESVTLENSNKIGLGYDPLHGTPVCYTGSCQMSGFRQQIFKLNYRQTPQGSCTSKLIPEFVSIDCLASSEVQAGTEVIDTLNRLKETNTKGFDISIGGKYLQLSGSYHYSEQTRSVIDSIVKQHTEMLFTTAKISYVKLSMFEPFMHLSDMFRYVIDNLPSSEYNDITAKYISDYIFGYFGYAYVDMLMLGGIALQNIFIDKSKVSYLQQQGIEKSHEAQLEFFATFSMKQKVTNDTEKHKIFMKYVKKSYSTVLGGDPTLQKMDEWSETVKRNPVIIKFGIKSISDLLNQRRFPSDSKIHEKSKLIERALNHYTQLPIHCYGGSQCTGHGICIDSGYFQFGLCHCDAGWSGVDCSHSIPLPPKPVVLSGTLCGYGDNIPCDAHIPSHHCPTGWQRTSHGYCEKSTNSNDTSPSGTLCGYHLHDLTVLCDGRNPYSDACPEGYKRSSDFRFCYKTNASANDSPGTLCGILRKQQCYGQGRPHPGSSPTVFIDVSCGGYYPGKGSCPPGYTLRTAEKDMSKSSDCPHWLGNGYLHHTSAVCSKH